MTFLELFQDNSIRLPIHQDSWTLKSFRQNLFERLDRYNSKIESLDFAELPEIYSSISEKKLVKNLIIGIKKSIDYYVEGYPNKAYNELKKSFDLNSFSQLTAGKLESKSNLFRLRKETGAYSL